MKRNCVDCASTASIVAADTHLVQDVITEPSHWHCRWRSCW